MESVLKYFEENYGVFECFNGCLDSFIFEKETERYIDILMEMISEFYTKDIIGLKEKASNGEIIIGGVRANDYYLRLLYAGVPEEKIIKTINEFETTKFIEKDVDTIFILHDIYKYDVALKLKDNIRGGKI